MAPFSRRYAKDAVCGKNGVVLEFKQLARTSATRRSPPKWRKSGRAVHAGRHVVRRIIRERGNSANKFAASAQIGFDKYARLDAEVTLPCASSKQLPGPLQVCECSQWPQWCGRPRAWLGRLRFRFRLRPNVSCRIFPCGRESSREKLEAAAKMPRRLRGARHWLSGRNQS